MFGKAKKFAAHGKLLIGSVAALASGKPVDILGASLDGFIALCDELIETHEGLAELAKEIDDRFTKALKSKAYDKPEDARVLLSQLLPIALSQPQAFVQRDLDAELILNDLKESLKRAADPEHRRSEIIAAFEKLYGPILKDVCDDGRLVKALKAPLMRDDRQRARRTEAGVEANNEQLQQVLSLLKGDEKLRQRFEENEAFATALARNHTRDNPSDMEGALQSIKALLEKYAKNAEHNRLPSNFRTAVGDLAAQAQARNDLGEVNEAYADLQAELARQAEARAQLLDLVITQAGYANDAEGLAQAELEKIQLDSSSAEDSFHRLRAVWLEQFVSSIHHGTPFANAVAISLARECIKVAPATKLTAMANNDLGSSLAVAAKAKIGEESAMLYAEAKSAFERALVYRTALDQPKDHAQTLTNIANVLAEQAERKTGDESKALFGLALERYRLAVDALAPYPKDTDWAEAVAGLGQGQLSLGERSSDVAQLKRCFQDAVGNFRRAAPLLREKVDAYSYILCIQGLVTALIRLSEAATDDDGDALLIEAKASLLEALNLLDPHSHPVIWSSFQHNLGLAYRTHGKRLRNAMGAVMLRRSARHYQRSLRIRVEAKRNLEAAQTFDNLADIHLELALNPTTFHERQLLLMAQSQADAAHQIYLSGNDQYYHNHSKALRAKIQAALSALPS